jgi:hypothetical protein
MSASSYARSAHSPQVRYASAAADRSDVVFKQRVQTTQSKEQTMSEELKELRVSNDAMDDPAELRRRIADEGYLFFKRLQDPAKLRELRREMMMRTSAPNARKAIMNTAPDMARSTNWKPFTARRTGPK